MIALALMIARAWVRIYTRGMPAAVRDERRAELESDLWEQREAERPCGHRAFATALRVLGRVLRGLPSDLSWRLEHRARGRFARPLHVCVSAARRHGWTTFPVLAALAYITGAARIGTPGFVDTPEQLAMALGGAAILCGLLLLWRGRALEVAVWLVCLGALAPTLVIARGAPLSLLWALLAMRAAVHRFDALGAERGPVASA